VRLSCHSGMAVLPSRMLAFFGGFCEIGK